MKIVVMSSCSAAYLPLAGITFFGSKMPYAQRHGYEFAHYLHPPGSLRWYDRVHYWLAELEQMEEGDWLFASGSDVIITNPETKIEQFIGPDLDFVCCDDFDVIHGDCWLMRSCAATKEMLRFLLTPECAEKWPSEQQCFAAYLCGKNDFDAYRFSVDRNWGEESFYESANRLLNGSPVRCRMLRNADGFNGDDPALWAGSSTVPGCHAWRPGMFCLHMGGKSLEERLRLLPGYPPPLGLVRLS